MNRREAEELLPWFVNGTLAADEAQAVQAFIDSGEIAPQAITELQLFSETISETTSDEPAYNPNILKNAMRKLEGVPQEHPEAPVVVRESALDKNDKKPGFLDSFFAGLTWSPMAKVAIGAQFAVILGLLVALGGGESTDEGFEVVAGGGQIEADLTVLFAPDSREADIRTLLLNNQATIVRGPSALGMYELDIASDLELSLVQSRLNESAFTTYVQPVAK